MQHDHSKILPGPRRRRGSALLMSLVVVLALTGVAFAMLTSSVAVDREASFSLEHARTLQLAEAGLNEALATVGTLAPRGVKPPAQIGTSAAPRTRAGGRYWCDIDALVDDAYRVVSTGALGLRRRRIEGVLVPMPGIFDYAFFAGNSSGDPTYSVEFGGLGAQADEIVGDVYSGGDVIVGGDATIAGNTDARGVIGGTSGTEGVVRRPPDLVAMDYPNMANFDVAALFTAATPGTAVAGDTALQLPEESPAHIFRLNPTNRSVETMATAKDDYFLEDPYEPTISHSSALTGLRHHTISLSGTMGTPGPSGTDSVYYIDGNLWIHSGAFYGIRLRNTDPEHARVTFVVRGNVYFSDDVEMDDPTQDAVAFIAMIDPDVEDSGNIYFGDPAYGTLRSMEGYMYAERDFYDNRLTGDASSIVTIRGAMTAGNQIAIESDWTDGSGTPQHTRLELQNDPRLAAGAVDLPGIPARGLGSVGYHLAFWRELTPR